MKKNLLFALSSLCALAASAAVEVAGGVSGTPANLNDEQYRNQDVILLPSTESPAQGAYFSGDTASTTTGTTLKSMTVKPSEEGPREWVLSRNITLDANGSESDYILDMGTKKTTYWLPTLGWFTIDNTGASTAPVKVRFGEFLFQNGASSFFNFYTDAEVSGTSLSLGSGNGHEGKLTMRIGNSALGKTANVIYGVGTTSFLKQASLNVQRGSSLTVAQGAVLSFANTSTFDLAGTLKYENTSSFLEIAGNMTIAETGSAVLSNALSIAKGGVVNIEARADGSAAISRASTGNGRIILNGGTLKVAAKNALAVNMIGLYAGSSSTLELSARNEINNIYFNSNTKLTLVLTGADASALVKSFGGAVDLAIEGFANEKVFFDSDGWWDSAKITATDGSKTYTKEQLELVATTGEMTSQGKYVLSLITVPEPSSYALVLGAIAIAFGMLQHARRGGGCRPQ